MLPAPIVAEINILICSDLCVQSVSDEVYVLSQNMVVVEHTRLSCSPGITKAIYSEAPLRDCVFTILHIVLSVPFKTPIGYNALAIAPSSSYSL